VLKSKLIAATAVLLAMAAPVSAQAVLTVSSEQTTTWVRNFNPFSQTSARATTKDFIYEPLAIFNRLAGNKWEYRLAESFVTGSSGPTENPSRSMTWCSPTTI
jgi:peptide/nickel transport system substrate-binding protein